MPRIKIVGYCSIEGCERPIKNQGICQYHYNKKRLEENPSKAKAGLRGHKLYHLWFERKQSNIVCERWLDFNNFIWDIEILNGGNKEN